MSNFGAPRPAINGKRAKNYQFVTSLSPKPIKEKKFSNCIECGEVIRKGSKYCVDHKKLNI